MGVDVWANPVAAKEQFGALPETMSLFDRLTGAEFLLYNGLLRGIDRALVVERSRALTGVLGLDDAVDRLVVDYSHGMTKKIALGGGAPARAVGAVPRRTVRGDRSGVHPRDRGGAESHVADGGTIVFSSHVLDVVERLCDHVVVIELGQIKQAGTVDEVRRGGRLEDAFLTLIGQETADTKGLTWLGSS